MVKATLSVFIAVLLPALALASENWDIKNRAVTENDIFGRELSETEAIVFARDIEELFARLPQGLSQDDANDLVGRNPSKAGRGFVKFLNIVDTVKTVVRREDDQELEVSAREAAELDAREPKYLGAKGELLGRGLYELNERDLEENLYSRELSGWNILIDQ